MLHKYMVNNGRMAELPLQPLDNKWSFFFFTAYEDMIHPSVDHQGCVFFFLIKCLFEILGRRFFTILILELNSAARIVKMKWQKECPYEE